MCFGSASRGVGYTGRASLRGQEAASFPFPIVPGAWLRLSKVLAKVLRGGSGWGAATHTALLLSL